MSGARREDRARIERENADPALSDRRQEAALDVRRAHLERDSARERLDAAEARLRAAEKALEFIEQPYAAGAATLYEVISGRADRTVATSASVRARYTLLRQQRFLDYSTGDLDPDGPLAP